MSEVDDAIAIGNFKIDAFERFVRLQLETAERQAGIAEKWEDVTKKHLENEESRIRLKELRRALRRFRLALKKARRTQRTIEHRISVIAHVQRRIGRLSLGESIAAGDVRRSWSGLKQAFVLCSRYYGWIETPPATNKDRKGKHYVFPHDRSLTCENAPSDIEDSLPLFIEWAYSKKVVPKRRSPPFRKLAALIESINDAFEEAVPFLEVDLEKADKNFAKLSAQDWRELASGAAE